LIGCFRRLGTGAAVNVSFREPKVARQHQIVLERNRNKRSNARQVGILFDQIFDAPKKLKRVNGLGEERKVVTSFSGGPKQIQRLSLP
jgi:hypothetical protein